MESSPGRVSTLENTVVNAFAVFTLFLIVEDPRITTVKGCVDVSVLAVLFGILMQTLTYVVL